MNEKRHLNFQVIAIIISISISLSLSPLICQADDVDFTTFSLEELKDVEIISLSKKPEKLSQIPAPVFVITQEDIRRSGVTSIPEALRLAPGVQVARITPTEWAITIRSSNEEFSENLLVLIDGRSVYSPVFSGVHWEFQDTVLEDIERIEVIRGPGSTVWGANAVNGVINIITKHAKDTRGSQFAAVAGSNETNGSIRYGDAAGNDAFYRVYAKYFYRKSDDDTYKSDDDVYVEDNWRSFRGGFRIDREPGDTADSMTLQGEIFTSHYDIETYEFNMETSPYTIEINDETSEGEGAHILGQWSHFISDTSDTLLQCYYDYMKTDYVIWYTPEYLDIVESSVQTIDLDFRHRFRPFSHHEIVWGLGYRFITDEFTTQNGYDISKLMDPPKLEQDIFSAFIQDEIELFSKQVFLTIGSKFEHNDYTGFEIQPGFRVLWMLHKDHVIWGAVSRAIRTPSRFERGGKIFTDEIAQHDDYWTISKRIGSEDLNAEKLMAYEIGYRTTLYNRLWFDITTFYHSYKDLIGLRAGEPYMVSEQLSYQVIPIYYDNSLDGDAHGIEIAAEWQITPRWRLKASYSYLETDLPEEDFDVFGATGDILDYEKKTNKNKMYPGNLVSLRSVTDITDRLEFDLWLRYVDRVEKDDEDVTYKDERPPDASQDSEYVQYTADESEVVDSYTALDAHLTWKFRDNLRLSIGGQNLLEKRHQEFSEYEVERSVYFKLEWNF